MEFPALYEEPAEFRRKLPLIVVGALCTLLGYTWTLISGLEVLALDSLPLWVLGGLAFALTVLDPRIGLGLLIFVIGISPEFEIWGVNNVRLEDFLLPVLLLSWLLRSAARRERLAPTNLAVPLLLTVLLSVVSSIYNSIYSELDLLHCSFRVGKSVECLLILTVALNLLRRRSDLVAFVYIMPLVGALVGIYGVIQLLQSQPRVTGPLGETSNILGGYYVLHICLAIGLITAGARYRPLLFAATLLMLVPLLHTLSRTSYVALFAGLLAIFAARRSFSTALVLVVSFLAIFASTGLYDRFQTIFDVFSSEAPNSFVMRVRGWLIFLGSLPSAPLLGQGVGRKALGAFDNEYIRLLFELGFFGLLLFVWLSVRIVRTSLQLSSRSAEPAFRGFAVGSFGATVALLVHAVGATTFTTIRTSEPFFLAMGLLYAIVLYESGSRPAQDEQLPLELPALPRQARLAPLGIR